MSTKPAPVKARVSNVVVRTATVPTTPAIMSIEDKDERVEVDHANMAKFGLTPKRSKLDDATRLALGMSPRGEAEATEVEFDTSNKISVEGADVTDNTLADFLLTDFKVNAPMRKALPKATIGPSHVRVDLPSNCVPYSFESLLVKPFDIIHLIKLGSVKTQADFTILIDVVDSVIDQDVRTLTVGDFYFVLFWLRLNSYPKSPYTITWTSVYGNENKTIIGKSDLKIISMELTKAQYAEYRKNGLTIPTIRDMEVQQINDDLPEDTKDLFEYAQYVDAEGGPNWLQNKIAKLSTFGVDKWELIRDMSKLITHGVVQQIEAQDAKFDYTQALAKFEEQKKDILKLIAAAEQSGSNEQDDLLAIMSLVSSIKNLDEEIKTIQDELDAGRMPLPRKEIVNIPMNVTSFFPTE